MSDMKAAIVPKSDQLNADDLIAGPITITITNVAIKTGEQPVSIFYDGDKGKPYKCCKSMARILVAAWGPDSRKYVGRSMTLYRDPTVKWAGMEVGGIRISHLSDIEENMTMALTMTRSNRKPFTVKPLRMTATTTAPASASPATVSSTVAPESGATSTADGQKVAITGEAKSLTDNVTMQDAPRPDPAAPSATLFRESGHTNAKEQIATLTKQQKEELVALCEMADINIGRLLVASKVKTIDELTDFNRCLKWIDKASKKEKP